ncbi:C6 transcription factor [Penicillium macrosclerotiorum]|uniref:C6 transcription factor n=1 Tax=Penicillium macrosclerotiorum TaxID=303699 RepID=UPI0025467AAE|nr:C6 transcription factor [Penicillium macrosclerotiorum]KAJ5692651.1 C6 transcription factor [Penicillium macrosclerotiorum]
MQDRICLHFNENGGEDGLRELYPEILRADQELKDLINKMPIFFKPNYDMTESPKGLNTQQSAVLMLSHAHKQCVDI